MEQEKWGLVLSGGGGKGAYQIGILKAMSELGLLDQVAAVAGSSIGALNAVLLTQNNVEKMQEVWSELSAVQIFSEKKSQADGIEKIIQMFGNIAEFLESATLEEYLTTGRTDGFCSRDGMMEIIDRQIDFDLVRSFPSEIYVTIAKMEQGVPVAEYHTLRDKSDADIKTLLSASSALPVIYDAVEWNGVYYRDGGIADNAPAKPLRDLGIKHIITIRHTKGEVVLPKYEAGVEQEIVIRPSHSIGDFIDGTIDFSHDNILYRMALGYRDGLCVFQEYDRINRGKASTALDFKMRMLENHGKAQADVRRTGLQEDVERHFAEFAKYEHYYEK